MEVAFSEIHPGEFFVLPGLNGSLARICVKVSKTHGGKLRYWDAGELKYLSGYSPDKNFIPIQPDQIVVRIDVDNERQGGSYWKFTDLNRLRG